MDEQGNVTHIALPGTRFMVFVRGGESSVIDNHHVQEPIPCASYKEAQALCLERNFQSS